MAGINVNQITSTLAKLPDRALQQYAQLHKNDPYVMSLAVSESNRRKELRAAGQGAQGGQPQPKVADAAIAQMGAQPMPEEMGIGALPAQNMQQMADGGIVGYDEGGMTYGQEPVMMMAEGGVARYQAGGDAQSLLRTTTGGKSWFLDVPQTMRDPSVPYYREITSPFAPLADKEFATKEEALAAYNQIAPAAAPSAKKVTPTFSPDDYSGMDRRSMSGSMPNIPSITPSAKPAPTEKRVATPPRPGAGPAAAAAASKEDPFSMAAIRKAQAEAMGDSNYKIGALNNQLVEIRNKAETQVQQRLDERRKEIEAEGDVYKDRSDRLVERAKGLAAQKNENTGLALLNAGLAIMSTPGKLMEAIGKGAQVGTAQYAAGIKDLRAAQERLDDANDRIAELRLNRKDLNSREIRALEKDRDNAIIEGQKMVFGFAKDVYGMDRKQAEATFTAYMSGQEKQAELKSREGIAAMQERGANARAGALPGEVRAAMLLGTGTTDAERLTSGMAKYKELTGDKQGTQLLKLFLEENGRREKNMEKPLTLEQFRRTSAAFYAPPAPVDTNKPTRP
jgi:hypothetical protein